MPARRNDVPPGPPGYPLVGALPAFARDPLGFLSGATRRHGDMLFLGKVLGRGVYVLTRPDHLKYILQENNRNYIKGNGLAALKLVVGEGLVVAEGERWHRQRRLVQPAFHRQRVAALVDQMADVIEKAHARWREKTAQEPVPVLFEMMRLTQRVLLSTMFGVDIESKADSLCKAWDVVVAVLTERLLSPPIHLPISVPTPKHLRFRRAMQTLDDAIYGILRDPESADRGLLSMLRAARDEVTGEGMSDRELRDEVMTIFAGGFETSAVALSWVWHVLGTHPEVEAKLHAEIDEVLGDRRPRMEDLPKLRYTKMVVEETLRLYPSAWIFARMNLAADEIDGYPIPPRSLLFVVPYLTHRHLGFWPDPETFDPERFTPDRSASRPRFAYVPFGGGPRLCVGEAFAMTEMQTVVAMTARRFRFRPVPGREVRERGMFTLRARPDIIMSIEERRPAQRSIEEPTAAI
ncbi:cytochrome P450 [Minicystis rosea]|nr:cytochrome P450 [Minicystis rosea]